MVVLRTYRFTIHEICYSHSCWLFLHMYNDHYVEVFALLKLSFIKTCTLLLLVRCASHLVLNEFDFD